MKKLVLFALATLIMLNLIGCTNEVNKIELLKNTDWYKLEDGNKNIYLTKDSIKIINFIKDGKGYKRTEVWEKIKTTNDYISFSQVITNNNGNDTTLTINTKYDFKKLNGKSILILNKTHNENWGFEALLPLDNISFNEVKETIGWEKFPIKGYSIGDVFDPKDWLFIREDEEHYPSYLAKKIYKNKKNKDLEIEVVANEFIYNITLKGIYSDRDELKEEITSRVNVKPSHSEHSGKLSGGMDYKINYYTWRYKNIEIELDLENNELTVKDSYKKELLFVAYSKEKAPSILD